MMSLVFAVPTFAASIPSSDAAKVTTTDTTLNIPYNIKVKNPTLTMVDGPDINYTFSIAPETISSFKDNTYFYDSNGNSANIHEGPANGVSITHNPSFTGNKTASSGGTNNSDNITLSVDLTKFSAPGVYRYRLTDTTTDATLKNAGMIRDPDYDPVRYVDVYIENSGNSLAVKGYVVSNNCTKSIYDNSSIDIIDYVDSELVKQLMGERTASSEYAQSYCRVIINGHTYDWWLKTGDSKCEVKDTNGNTGLYIGIDTDPETGNSSTIAQSASVNEIRIEEKEYGTNEWNTLYEGPVETETIDTYNTYNITVENEVTGAMGNRSNQFAFTGTVANNGSNNFYVKKGSAPTVSDSMVSSIPNFTLAHGEKYYISGLGPKATIAYTERNNTSDTYKVTINGKNNSQISAQSSIYAGSTKSMSATAITNYATANNSGTPNTEATLGNSSEVKFTNHLDSVSPTGVVMRYGPYIGMFVIAMMLLAVYKRTRKTNNVA